MAELVAGGASQPSVFDAVAQEACRLLGGHFTALLRYEPDGPAVIVAMWGAEAVRHVMRVGMRLSEDGDGMVQRVRRSARAERMDSYEGVPGSNATTARELGLTSGVGAPIITEGRVWGAITVLGSGPPLPASAEDRLGMFAKLVATRSPTRRRAPTWPRWPTTRPRCVASPSSSHAARPRERSSPPSRPKRRSCSASRP